MRFLSAFLVVFLLLLAAVEAPAAAERRVALVIGNGAYHGSPLKNPVNDARAMARALKELGFEVIARENVGLREMTRAVTQFGEKAAGGGVALFYYAGHGMQVRGKNFLIPVDAQISSEASARSESLDVDGVLEQLSGSRVSMVILDACRNNPFERRFRSAGGGLAQIDAPKGSLIAYATAPGKVAADGEGANGLYTSELLKALGQPGLRIEDVFKRVRVAVARASNDNQIPWEASSLTGDFYFREALPAPAQQAAPAPDAEILFWQSIAQSDNPADFEEYLRQFPRGRFAGLARNRLAGPSAALPSPPSQPQQQAALPTPPLLPPPADGDGLRRALADAEALLTRMAEGPYFELSLATNIARRVCRAGDFERGRRLLSQAAQAAGREESAFLRAHGYSYVGRAAAACGDPELARSMVSRVESTGEKGQALALARAASGDVSGARASLDEIEGAGSRADAAYWVVRVRLDAGDKLEALQPVLALVNVAEENPAAIRAHAHVARLHHALGHSAKAEAAITRAGRLAEGLSDAFDRHLGALSVAIAWREMNNRPQALAWLERSERAVGGISDPWPAFLGHWGAGREAALLGDTARAETALRRMRSIRPSLHESAARSSWRYEAALVAGLGRRSEAERIVESIADPKERAAAYHAIGEAELMPFGAQ